MNEKDNDSAITVQQMAELMKASGSKPGLEDKLKAGESALANLSDEAKEALIRLPKAFTLPEETQEAFKKLIKAQTDPFANFSELRKEAFLKSLKTQTDTFANPFANLSEETREALRTLHKKLTLSEEQREALKKSLEVQTAPFRSVMRLSGELEKSFEPVRKALNGMLQQSEQNLPDNTPADSQSRSDNDMLLQEFARQAIGVVENINSTISAASTQSNDRAKEANLIALSANEISIESLKTARESNKISEKANEIATGANTRSTCSMCVAIVCAVISSTLLLEKLYVWLVAWFSK